VRSSKKATPQKTSTTCPTDISEVNNKTPEMSQNITPPPLQQQQQQQQQQQKGRSPKSRQIGCFLSADVSSKDNSPPANIKI